MYVLISPAFLLNTQRLISCFVFLMRYGILNNLIMLTLKMIFTEIEFYTQGVFEEV